MSKPTSGERMIEGMKEVLAIVKGKEPAASIHLNGHDYVPRSALLAVEAEIDRLREALDEALEGWTEGAQYKGDYLTKKHGDWERIAECRKLLAKGEAGQ